MNIKLIYNEYFLLGLLNFEESVFAQCYHRIPSSLKTILKGKKIIANKILNGKKIRFMNNIILTI